MYRSMCTPIPDLLPRNELDCTRTTRATHFTSPVDFPGAANSCGMRSDTSSGVPTFNGNDVVKNIRTAERCSLIRRLARLNPNRPKCEIAMAPGHLRVYRYVFRWNPWILPRGGRMCAVIKWQEGGNPILISCTSDASKKAQLLRGMAHDGTSCAIMHHAITRNT